MKLNIKFLIVIIILLLAIVLGFRALERSNKLSADAQKQSKMIEQLSR